MKRTTIYLEEELETRLKSESLSRGVPMAEFIRVAIGEKLDREETPRLHRHAGAFSSGRGDTASDVDAALEETEFGRDG